MRKQSNQFNMSFAATSKEWFPRSVGKTFFSWNFFGSCKGEFNSIPYTGAKSVIWPISVILLSHSNFIRR